MTLAIAVPDYSEYGIKGPYFGDMVFDALQRYTGKVEKINVRIKRFPGGSQKVRLEENVRGRDIYLIHTQYVDPNIEFMLALQTLDAAYRSVCHVFKIVELYNDFFRQDSRWGREPVTARIIADCYHLYHMRSLFTAQPHSKQLVGFFHAAEPLPMAFHLAKYVGNRYDLSNTVVMPPDAGAYDTAEEFASILKLPMAVVPKKDRQNSEKVDIRELLGDVEGRDVLVYDDVIGSGGTIEEATAIAKSRKARSVKACATHLGLYNSARERILKAGVEKVMGTNTYPQQFSEEEKDIYDIFDMAPLIAHAIFLDYNEDSISRFFPKVQNK